MHKNVAYNLIKLLKKIVLLHKQANYLCNNNLCSWENFEVQFVLKYPKVHR